jgi:hypothetical protein
MSPASFTSAMSVYFDAKSWFRWPQIWPGYPRTSRSSPSEEIQEQNRDDEESTPNETSQLFSEVSGANKQTTPLVAHPAFNHHGDDSDEDEDETILHISNNSGDNVPPSILRTSSPAPTPNTLDDPSNGRHSIHFSDGQWYY